MTDLSNKPEEIIQITKEMVDAVDGRYPTPTADFKEVSAFIHESGRFTTNQVANFASLYLMSVFDKNSAEFKRQKFVTANLHFYHYAINFKELSNPNAFAKEQEELKKEVMAELEMTDEDIEHGIQD